MQIDVVTVSTMITVISNLISHDNKINQKNETCTMYYEVFTVYQDNY